MHARRSLNLTLAACLTAASLVGGGVVASRALADPDQDTPQSNANDGTVYANRQIPSATLIDGASAGNNYTYWTTGADGASHLSTASVYQPVGKAPAGGWPVIAWTPGSNGSAGKCQPSAGLQATDSRSVTTLLRKGYAVIVPDLTVIGTAGSPQYADNVASARLVLHAVEAGTDIDSDLSPRWAVVGENQSSAAAIVLARKGAAWQSDDLDFRGSVAQSIPAGFGDLVAGLGPSSPDVPPAVIADVIYALANLSDGPDGKLLRTHLSAAGRSLVARAGTACHDDLVRAVGRLRLAKLVRTPIAKSPKLAAAIRSALSLPTEGFARPVLLSQPLTDSSVVVTDALRYAAQAQLGSNKVTMRTYLTGDESDARRQEQSVGEQFLADLF